MNKRTFKRKSGFANKRRISAELAQTPDFAGLAQNRKTPDFAGFLTGEGGVRLFPQLKAGGNKRAPRPPSVAAVQAQNKRSFKRRISADWSLLKARS